CHSLPHSCLARLPARSNGRSPNRINTQIDRSLPSRRHARCDCFYLNRDLATIHSRMPGFLETISRFLVQAVPSISRGQQRWEFANIAAAVALLSIAFVAIALFLFRRKTRDPTLIYFAIFRALYAVRLLASVRSFRALFNEPGSFWDYVNWDITCTILVPFGLFFYQVGSEFLRKFFRWLL